MKISDGVELIEGTMAHTYNLEVDRKTVLVDAGTKGSARKIIDFYRKKGKEPDLILITHYHMDHIGGLQLLMENFSSDVYVPDNEVDIISGKKGMPDGTPAILRMFTKVPKVQQPERLKPVSELNLEGVEVVETHGHTPGSTSYHFLGSGSLCVGDALYNKRGTLAVNRMFSLDMERANSSKEKILAMHPILILPGHGDPVRI